MNLKSEIPISFKCPKCPSTSIEIEDEEDSGSQISCTECGYVYGETWGEFKERATKFASEQAMKAIKDTFKK